MESEQMRIDEVLESFGVTRGRADNVRVGIRSFTLFSGDQIHLDHPGVTVVVGANNCGKSTLLAELNAHLIARSHAAPRIIGSVEVINDGELEDYADWLARNAHLMTLDHTGPIFSRLGATVEVRSLQSHVGYSPSSAFPADFFVKFLRSGDREIRGSMRKELVLGPPEDALQMLSGSTSLMDELNAITYKILKQRIVHDDLNQHTVLRVGATTVPYPEGRHDDATAYQTEVNSLPLLNEQGDGMRSLMNILIPLVTATYPVLIIDEPEAFLHPPQAFALGQELGRIAGAKNVQVVLATHDRHLLAGLVNADAPLSVVRLVRDASNTARAHQLRSGDLRDVMKDPVLKYSHVLDGLFHEVVILAEAERDCRFYEAAIDAHDSASPESDGGRLPLPVTEILFIPTSGTSSMPRVAKALRSLNVPVMVCADLDVLDNDSVLKNILESLGQSWADLASDWLTAIKPLNDAISAEPLAAVNLRVKKVFDRILKDNHLALYDGDAKKAVAEALRAPSRPWDEVKHHGVDELMRRNKGNAEAVRRLLDGLAKRNFVVVRAGELESFGHELGAYKGKNWLPAAFEADLQRSPKVQEHVRQLLAVAVPLTSRANQTADGWPVSR